jgi:predicted Zn-dependent protease
MALATNIVTRLADARTVLEAALEKAPAATARAMVLAQLGWVASKQGRVNDAFALVAQARAVLGKNPPVLDAIIADALVRRNRWPEALAAAKACTQSVPKNTAAWSIYARVLVAIGDYVDALAAARRGLALSPRDPDLLLSQATALAGLDDPQAPIAQAAYVRFRTPDDAATLRIRCATQSERCWRERNPVQTLTLRPVSPSRH